MSLSDKGRVKSAQSFGQVVALRMLFLKSSPLIVKKLLISHQYLHSFGQVSNLALRMAF